MGCAVDANYCYCPMNRVYGCLLGALLVLLLGTAEGSMACRPRVSAPSHQLLRLSAASERTCVLDLVLIVKNRLLKESVPFLQLVSAVQSGQSAPQLLPTLPACAALLPWRCPALLLILRHCLTRWLCCCSGSSGCQLSDATTAVSLLLATLLAAIRSCFRCSRMLCIASIACLGLSTHVFNSRAVPASDGYHMHEVRQYWVGAFSVCVRPAAVEP